MKNEYYNGLSLKDAINAGYVDDEGLFSYSEQVEDFSNGVILVTTGSFAYLHEGHLKMMEIAKDFLLKKNIFVEKGYFSFTHDKYVQKKDSNMPNFEKRYNFAKEKLKYNDWLFVDDWGRKSIGHGKLYNGIR